MISYNSNNQADNSKYNTSLINVETSRLNFSKSRFNYYVINPKRKNISVKKKEIKSKLLKKKTNTLFKIFEEDKEKNNIDNKLKPKLTLKELHKIIYKRFFNEYKKHYINIRSISSNPGTEKPTVYGYYQINNLLENKKCEIKVNYDEFQLDISNKENLIAFMDINQSHTLLRFLITFLHRNNIYNNYIHMKERFQYKTSDFINCIKIMTSLIDIFQKNQKSNLLSIINIVKKISNENFNKNVIETDTFKAIFDFLKDNNIFESNNIKDLSNNLNEYIKYLPILFNIPLISYKSIFPNYSAFGFKINLLIKKYLSKRLREVKINIIQKIINSEKGELTKKKAQPIKYKYNQISYRRFFNDSLLKSQRKSSIKKESKDETIDNNKSILDTNKKKIENTMSSDISQIHDIKNLIKSLYKAQAKNKNNVVTHKDIGGQKIKNKKNFIEKNNENKNVKKISSLKMMNFTRNSNNKIVLQKRKNKKENGSVNKNSNSIYKKNLIEDKNRTINSMIIQRSNYNHISEKNNSSKLITQYNNKVHIHKYKNKNIFNSLSESKNSSKDLSKYIKGKNVYTNSLISTLASNENTNNFFQKSISQRFKIYNLKDSKKFFVQGLKKNKRFTLNKIILRNISNFNMDLYMKYYCDKLKNKYKFNPIKTYDVKLGENVWEKGIFSSNEAKKNYNYNKLMYKIQNFRNKQLSSKKLLDRNINALYISKMSGIYDDL